MRDRRPAALAAPLANGHASTSLSHYGNISYRLGQPLPVGRIRETLCRFDHALEVVAGIERHLGEHGVDLTRHPLAVGPWVTPDRSGTGIAAVANVDEAALARARYLAREAQRPPFVIPDTA